MKDRLFASHCAVILVNYNNALDTLACIASLHALNNAPAWVAVVDNGSSPEELNTLRDGWRILLGRKNLLLELCPDSAFEIDTARCRSVLLSAGVNAGFAAGNNAALRLLLEKTDCPAFWLLNNDTEPEPGALDALCARLNEKLSAGLCGSTLVSTHSPDILQAAGGCTYSPWTGRTAFLWGETPRNALTSLTPAEAEALEAGMGYVVGASCLVRREVLEQAGLLPEDYFLYYEDTAFSLNALRAGFTLAWARKSVVLHKEGASTNASRGSAKRKTERPPYVDYLSIRNRIAIIHRYSPWALPIALCGLVGTCFNRIRRGQTQRIPLVCRAAWDGLRGRMGPPPSLTE